MIIDPRYGIDDGLTVAHPPDRFGQHDDSPRLVHESHGTARNCVNDGLLVVVGAEDNHFDTGICEADRIENVNVVGVGQCLIEQTDLRS